MINEELVWNLIRAIVIAIAVFYGLREGWKMVGKKKKEKANKSSEFSQEKRKLEIITRRVIISPS